MSTTPPNSTYIPVKELQALIGCTRTSAIRLIESGEVGGRKIGGRWYASRAAVEALAADA